MRAKVLLNDKEAILILAALEVKINNLKEDMFSEGYGHICNADKSELRRLEMLSETIDKTFWTRNGNLKE